MAHSEGRERREMERESTPGVWLIKLFTDRSRRGALFAFPPKQRFCAFQGAGGAPVCVLFDTGLRPDEAFRLRRKQ